MWCSTCHQDMPSVAHATTGRMVCSRCQRTMRTTATGSRRCHLRRGHRAGRAGRGDRGGQPARGWTIGRTTNTARELGRELRRPGDSTAAAIRIPSGPRRFDPPQDLFAQLTQQAASERRSRRSPSPPCSTRLHSRRSEGAPDCRLVDRAHRLAAVGRRHRAHCAGRCRPGKCTIGTWPWA